MNSPRPRPPPVESSTEAHRVHRHDGAAQRDGVTIWFDVHGAAGVPVVLLAGAALQAIQWEVDVIQPLVDAGHRIVRIDWRDIGLSTWGDFRDRPYGLAELADDVVAVLDAEGLDAAHMVGFSMGGIVAQHVAVRHPGRVITLATLGAGFAGGMRLGGTAKSRDVLGYLATRPDPADLEPWLIGQWRVSAGRGFDFDDDEWTVRVRRWMARGQNPRCPHLRIPEHERRVADPALSPAALTAALATVTVPTLVLHGDDDGMFVPANGELIAATVPGARLVVLPDRGHDLFRDPSGEIADHLLAHFSAAPR